MPKIITITNQKGGVGKTTTTINLAAGVAAKGKRVLAVDLDPQGNCTSGLGLSKKDLTRSTYDLLAGTALLSEVKRETHFGFDLVPCNMQLSGAGVELAETEGRATRLRRALLPALREYDFVFIDCPPALDLLTLNGLSACDTVLIPVSCEYFSLEGLSELVGTIRRVEKTYNQYIEMEGILLTMYDDRLNVTRLIEKDVKAHFKGKVYKTVIPRNIRLTEAPSFGKPVRAFSPKSKGAAAYDALAAELIRQNEYS